MADNSSPQSTLLGINALDLNAQGFIDDVCNAVVEYCAEEFDDFERIATSCDGLSDKNKTVIRQGIQSLYEDAQAQLQSGLAKFERWALHSSFHVPAGLLFQQEESCDAEPELQEEERQLSLELAALRSQLAAHYKVNRALRREVADLDRELVVVGEGGLRELAALGEVIQGKENLQQDAEAAMKVVQCLQPLLAQTSRVLQQLEGSAKEAGAANGARDVEKELFRRQNTAMKGLELAAMERTLQWLEDVSRPGGTAWCEPHSVTLAVLV